MTFNSTACNGEKKLETIWVNLNELVSDSLPFVPEFKFIRNESKYDSYKNVSNIDSIQVGYIVVQPESNQQSDQLTKEITDNKILILRGKRGFDEVVLVDTDNDKNFENEHVYLLNENTPFIKVSNVDFIIGKKVIKHSFLLQPAYSSFSLPVNTAQEDKRLFGVRIIPIFRFGILDVADAEKYKLAVFNHFYNQYTFQNSSLIIIPESNQFPSGITRPVKYKIGDTIYLDKKVYLFKSINDSGDLIELIHIDDLTESLGVLEGNYVFKYKLNDIQTGKLYEFGNSGKYTLIDFWGTWCMPCLELTDELKTIHKRYSGDEFEIVSLAYDNSEKKVLSYLNKESIEWKNFFDNMENSVTCSKFKVKDFPTFLLLDKDGKILIRGVGKETLERIQLFLKNKF